MCGIGGVYALDPAVARARATEFAGALRHRGPDADGLVAFDLPKGSLALSHRRLAIRDLSQMGAQPMLRRGGAAAIVYNGELYGIEALRRSLERSGETFAGTSDTEVLLAALLRDGPDCLRDLDGIYAFALFDRSTRSLLLARDAFGVKPLYLHEGRDTLMFASEARPLARALGKTALTDAAMAAFLATGSVPAHIEPYAGVLAFPRATWRRYQWEDASDGPRMRLVEEGSTFPRASVSLPRDFAAAAVELRGRVESAVASQLISDVPVGVFLSSGLDSSIIAHAAARAGKDTVAVTFGLDAGTDTDEAPAAAALAARCGLKHVVQRVPLAEVPASLEAWLAAVDVPSIDGWNTFLVSRATRALGIKVALSGLGADELFAGYPAFTSIPRLTRIPTLLASAASIVPQRAFTAVDALRGGKLHDLLAAAARGEPRAARLALALRRLLADDALAMLGLRHAIDVHEDALARALARITPDGAPLGTSIALAEATSYMGDTLLRDADLDSMAHGLELRVPFLARDVATFALALPDAWRMPPGGGRKALLRAAFPGVVPEAQITGTKRGFFLPIGAWLDGPLRSWADQARARLRSSGRVDPAALDRLWNAWGPATGRSGASRRMALAMLGHFT